MEQNQFKCTGNCIKCHPNQRQYCTTQFTYNSMRMIEDVQKALESMNATIAELQQKIDAIQGNEASIFDPTELDTEIETNSAASGVAQ